MPGTGDNDSFDIGRHIKEKYEQIPIVILTPFSHGITKRIAKRRSECILTMCSVGWEIPICWCLSLSLIEDKMNLEHDVKEVGVQLILLVEDSIRFYSSVLPNLYKFVLKQSQEFSTEALNAHQRTPVCVVVPKLYWLVLTRKRWIYIISILTIYWELLPMSVFLVWIRGEKDGMAGIKLCAEVRKKDPFVPLIIQSSETENATYREKIRGHVYR